MVILYDKVVIKAANIAPFIEGPGQGAIEGAALRQVDCPLHLHTAKKKDEERKERRELIIF